MKTPSLTSRFALLLGSIVAFQSANATDLATNKLYARWTKPDVTFFGTNMQMDASEKWLIVGHPESAEQGTFQGALQVFNGTTGAWVRKILPNTAPTDQPYFGGKVAISGDLAVVTAPYIGKAYVVDLNTGKILRTLTPEDANNNFMGHALAMSGSRVIIGSSQLNAHQGAAYVFELSTGIQLAKLTASDGAANHFFGSAIAAEGNIAVITATGADAERGAGYLFDLTTFAEITKLQPANSGLGDHVGSAVAMHQGHVILGAPDANAHKGRLHDVRLIDGLERTLSASDGVNNDQLGTALSLENGLLIAGCPNRNNFRGCAYAFDLHSLSNIEFNVLLPADSESGAFGYTVTQCRNQVFISATSDSTLGPAAGVVWQLRPVTKPMPVTKVIAKGDAAHGAANINYNTLGEAVIDIAGNAVIASSLTGAGSNSNKDVGIWSTMGATHTPDLVAKSRDLIDVGTISSVKSPTVNVFGKAIFRATLAGPGITTANNSAIYSEDGLSATRLFRTGEDIIPLNLARIASFTTVVQGQTILPMACVLRQGIAGTTAVNDSAILVQNFNDNSIEAQREGSIVPGYTNSYGQFTGRVACYLSQYIYSAATTDPVPFNAAVFQKQPGQNPAIVATKGEAAPNAIGASFSSFVGETVDQFNTALFRATLSGVGVTTANNEGLWTRTQANIRTLVFHKGDIVPGTNGAKIGKIIQFWPATDQTMALVQLTGTGVSSANDQALLLYQTTTNVEGTVLVLIREGDSAPGCRSAKIGTISRVEVEAYGGHYLVLATLAAAAPGTDLGLFQGNASVDTKSPSNQTLRRPVLALRKGALYNNQPSPVKSIAMLTTNVTASGAGWVGLGRAIQQSASLSPAPCVVTVSFDNGVVQVMKGGL